MKVVVYCRFSPGRDRAGSPSNRFQFQRCRLYCQAKQYKIIGVHWDREKSGMSMNRPGLQRAVAHACRRQAILLIAKIDRLSRGLQDCLKLVDILKKAGADLASVTEPINTHSPLGRAFFQIAGVFAELERETIRERLRLSSYHLAKDGRRISSRVSYGFKLNPENPKYVIPEKSELLICDKIFLWIRDGWTTTRIVRTMNKEGPSFRGKRWSSFKIRAILRRGYTNLKDDPTIAPIIQRYAVKLTAESA